MTKDNRCLQLAIPQYDKFIGKVLDIIGAPELLEIEQFSSFKKLGEHTAEMTDHIQNQISQKNVDEWMALFEEADLPCEKAYLWDEIIEDEHAWANDYLRKVTFDNGNEGVLVNTPVKFANDEEDRFTLGPKLGEHTEEVLLSLGYSKEDVKAMAENKDVKVRV